MSAVVRHQIIVTSLLVILFGTTCELSSSLHAKATSMIVARGLSGSTYIKHSRRNNYLYGDKLINEVLRREEDASDDKDEFPPSRRRRRRHDPG